MKSKFVSVVVCLAFLAMLAVPAALAPIASAAGPPVWSVGDSWMFNIHYDSGTGQTQDNSLSISVTDDTGDNYKCFADYDPDALRVEDTTDAPFLVLSGDISVNKANMQYQQEHSSTILVFGSLPDIGTIEWNYGSTPPVWPLNVGETWDFTKHSWDARGVVDLTVSRQAKVLAVEDVTVPKGTYSCLHIVEYDPASPGTYTCERWFSEAMGLDVKVIDRDIYKGEETRELAPYTPPESRYTLTINANHGSVAKDPDQAQYLSGTQVSLTAVPDTGYHFDHWSDDASGTDNPVDVTMDADKTVTANFTINTYTLNLNATSGGSATKDPDQTQYDWGTEVTLTANADATHHFTKWTGDASGTTNPLTITMDANKIVTAHFASDTAPDPATTSLDPICWFAGQPDFTLTVNGSNFVEDLSVVRWNGSARTTHYVSDTQLTADIPASDVASAGTASVMVYNAGAVNPESNAQTFTIYTAEPPPFWSVGDNWLYKVSYNSGTGVIDTGLLNYEVTGFTVTGSTGLNYKLRADYVPDANRVDILGVETAKVDYADASVNILNMLPQQESAAVKLFGYLPDVTTVDFAYDPPAPIWPPVVRSFTKHYWDSLHLINLTVSRQGRILGMEDVVIGAKTYLNCMHIVEYDPEDPANIPVPIKYTYEHWVNADVGFEVKMIDRDSYKGEETRELILPPIVNSITPDNGPVGTEVTVSGLHFGSTQGSSYISFGSLQAIGYTSWSDAEVKCKVPEGVAGEVPVTLTVYGQTSNSLPFTECNTPTGTDVQVDLGQGSGITFGQVTSPGDTTYTPQPDPEVANFAVQDGSSYDLSTTATFTGKILLSLAYDENELTVEEESLRLLHYEGGNWVDVTKGVDIVNNIITGEVTSLSPFVTAWTSSLPRPSIGTVNPAQGLAGSEVTVTGTAFGSSQGKSFVKFGTEHATVTSWKDTEIHCKVPSGIEGPVQLKVSTPGGTSEGIGFKVIPPPTVTSITPNVLGNGSGNKSAAVTISGFNFLPKAKVMIVQSGVLKPKKRAAKNVVVVDANTITCNLNFTSALPGTYDVVVTNKDKSTGTLKGGLTVNPHPVITKPTAPFSGKIGTPSVSLTLNGSNFVSGATVKVYKIIKGVEQDIPVTNLNVSSSTITCDLDLTSAHLGSYKGVVTNLDGGIGTFHFIGTK